MFAEKPLFQQPVSADGSLISFTSASTNLVPGDTNRSNDVFVVTNPLLETKDGIAATPPPPEPKATPVPLPSHFTVELVSVASDDTQGNESSGHASISARGRFVAFTSTADNLVPRDTNESSDIFVHDRKTGTIDRVSVASDGAQADDGSAAPSISADGRFVAFQSSATNLVPEDTNRGEEDFPPGSGFISVSGSDVFVHDRQTGETQRISVTSDGAQSVLPSFSDTRSVAISADGRYVTFDSEAFNLVTGDVVSSGDLNDIIIRVFVHDRQTGTTELVSVSTEGVEANGGSAPLSISADGRFVAFGSSADNLVPEGTNGASDVFVRDRQSGETVRVSVSSEGLEGNGETFEFLLDWTNIMSADGRYIAFVSLADNLVPQDTNTSPDVFVHDREPGETVRVSVDSDGAQANGESWSVSIDGSGRFVVFMSVASNLVPGDTNEDGIDIFVHDRSTGLTQRVNVASNGAQSRYSKKNVGFYLGSLSAQISADGRFIVFDSAAFNLVSEDANEHPDVFVVTNPLFEPTATSTPTATPVLEPPTAPTPTPVALKATPTPMPKRTPTVKPSPTATSELAVPTPRPTATATLVLPTETPTPTIVAPTRVPVATPSPEPTVPSAPAGGGCLAQPGLAKGLDLSWLFLGVVVLGLASRKRMRF